MAYPIVHVYAQPEPHEAAYVAGNMAGLVALRKALDEAIKEGTGEAHTFANDGEGFSAFVQCLPDDLASRLRLPYADLDTRDGYDEDDAIYPWDADVVSDPLARVPG